VPFRVSRYAPNRSLKVGKAAIRSYGLANFRMHNDEAQN
jgi:hypothetical protein